MQLDAVESRFARPYGGIGEERRQDVRKRDDVRLCDVGDALARASPQRLELAGRQHAIELPVAELRKPRPHGPFRRILHVERLAMRSGNGEIALEELARIGPAPHVQEIDQLNVQPRLAVARAAHGVDERAQSRHEARLADAQQRPARDVADTGGLDDQSAGAPAGEALVPGEYVRGDDALLGRAPRHHRGHPGPLAQLLRAQADRLEEA